MLSKTCINALTLICCLTSIGPLKLFAGGPTTIVELAGDHLAAVNRQRRIIYHHDAGANVHHPLSKVGSEQIADVVRLLVSPLDAPDTQVDSVWYAWSAATGRRPGPLLARTPRRQPRTPGPRVEWSSSGRGRVAHPSASAASSPNFSLICC